MTGNFPVFAIDGSNRLHMGYFEASGITSQLVLNCWHPTHGRGLTCKFVDNAADAGKHAAEMIAKHPVRELDNGLEGALEMN